MLRLTNIVKQYRTGDETVDALRGVNIDFRESEFVSVLGPSGCGKTTLLNIIGGLDQYTSGDLIIDGRIYDFGVVFDDFKGFAFTLHDTVGKGSSNFESYYSREYTSVRSHFKVIIKAFDKLS